MKKIYSAPASEIVELEVSSMILAGSTGDIETGGGGEVSPTVTDPNDDDWGSDY